MALLHSIAVDLGAASGRVMLSTFDGERLHLKEVHRFPNAPLVLDGRYYWDLFRIFEEIKGGLQKAARYSTTITSIGIDSWGVDFGYIDQGGNLMANPLCYRDFSGKAGMTGVHQKISQEELYGINGVVESPINSLYRLSHDLVERGEDRPSVKHILFIPCLISYLLTGQAVNEYTIASTSGLLDLKQKDYSRSLLKRIGLGEELFPPLLQPGKPIGPLKDSIRRECGLNEGIRLIAVAGHDTACAVCATPLEKGSCYVILGTWVLVGVELEEPLRTQRARQMGFTNEGGVFGTIRFLKNIPGLWVMDQWRKGASRRGIFLSLADIDRIINTHRDIPLAIDYAEERFVAPLDMYLQVEESLKERYGLGEVSPEQAVMAVFNGLVAAIERAVEDLEELGIGVEELTLLGGGVNSPVFCAVLQEGLKRRVVVGPAEASAMGNALMQLVVNTAKRARQKNIMDFIVRLGYRGELGG